VIAADTSVIIAFLNDERDESVEVLDQALGNKCVVLPPVVLSELMSDPEIPETLVGILLQIPLLPITRGYWERAGRTRASVIKHKHKARLADTLIAQSCLDHQVPLITLDQDFHHFSKLCGLELVMSAVRRR
jgi:predicted nucleic acid-binding protein